MDKKLPPELLEIIYIYSSERKQSSSPVYLETWSEENLKDSKNNIVDSKSSTQAISSLAHSCKIFYLISKDPLTAAKVIMYSHNVWNPVYDGNTESGRVSAESEGTNNIGLLVRVRDSSCWERVFRDPRLDVAKANYVARLVSRSGNSDLIRSPTFGLQRTGVTSTSNTGTSFYNSLLDFACKKGSMELARIALQYHNGHHESEEDLLMISEALVTCASHDSNEIFELLLQQRGADIHYENDACVITSAMQGHLECLKTCIRYGANVRTLSDLPLLYASKYGNIECVKLLLDSGVPANAGSCRGIQWAAENGHNDILELLISKNKEERGYNAMIEDLNSASGCALRWSATKGHYECVKTLLMNGANPHFQDELALLNTAKMGHLKVIELLISHGANGWVVYNSKSKNISDEVREFVRNLIENGFQDADGFFAAKVRSHL